MSKKTKEFNQPYLKKDLPEIRPGDTVRISQKIREGDKERIQSFEGLVLARKHGKGVNATISVRKVVSGIGVERVFPLHSPTIEKIEVLKRGKVRRAKLYYLKEAKGKRAKIKRREKAEVSETSEAFSGEGEEIETEEGKKPEMEEKETEL